MGAYIGQRRVLGPDQHALGPQFAGQLGHLRQALMAEQTGKAMEAQGKGHAAVKESMGDIAAAEAQRAALEATQ